MAWFAQNRFATIQNKIYQYRYFWCFFGIGIVFILNLLLDVMEVDAAQYASISREMFENKSFLEVFERGHDYLDKPPMLFWLSSLSFYIFGVHNFSYKLPALIVIILGIYSTYRLSLLWYDKKRSLIAALILCSTQALLLITNDVRTDGILMGFVTFSIWQLSAFLKTSSYRNLILASFGLAAALMSKGPIGLMIPTFGLGGHLIMTRNWRAFFKPQWLVLLAIVSILLLPMCYGLYTQFDLHPEKEVYGLKGPSGLKFFFWTQSFGRITGDSQWDNDSSFFYFFHTILWDFQPWILFFIPALFLRIRKMVLTKFNGILQVEYITLFGFMLSFVILSKSHYKLPHYIFPLFPLAAIITADFLVNLTETNPKWAGYLSKFQFYFLSLFFVVILIGFLFFFPPNPWFHPLFWVVSLVIYCLIFLRITDNLDKIVLLSLIAIIFFGINTSTYFYPNLLNYQASSNVGKYIYQAQIPKDRFYYYKQDGHALDFYTQRIVPEAKLSDLDSYPKETLIFTDLPGSVEIEKNGHYRINKTFDDFHITLLKLPFLYQKTRYKMLEKRFLLEKVE